MSDASAASAATASPAATAGSAGSAATAGTATPSETTPGAAAPPPAARVPVPWKTKAKVNDEEHEVEIDVDPFLQSYRRKVKVDGEELEVDIDTLAKGHERVRSSMKRFDEAAKLKKQVDADKAKLDGQVKALETALGDPKRVLAIARKTLGEDKFLEEIVGIVAERMEYEKLPPAERKLRDAQSDGERKAAEREKAIADREKALEERERREKAAKEERVGKLAEASKTKLIEKWTPALEAAGLPATIPGKDGKAPVPNMRIISMLAGVMNRAREAGAPLRLEDAVEAVREEYDQLVGPAVERRRKAELDAIQEQPGRGERAPEAERAGPPRRRNTEEPMSTSEYLRSLREARMKGQR